MADESTRLKRLVLLVATLASFLTPFMGSAMNVAMPTIGKDLHLTAVTLNWVVTAYLLATAVFLLPFGRAGDLYGRKKIFLTGLTIYTIASLGCGLARTGPMLVSLRVVQGCGSAMMFGTGMAILSSVFPPGERGRAIGWSVAAVYTGLSIGPPVGGILTQQVGWRSIFHLNFLVGLVVISAVVWGLRGEWRDSERRRYDFVGAITYGFGVAAILFGIASVNVSPVAPAILAVGVMAFAGFLAREWTFRDSLIDLRLFRNPVFAFSNLAALIHYSATAAVGYLLSFYLQEIRDLRAQAAGLVLLSQPVVMAVVSPLAGRLSDRWEPRVLASIGMAVTLVGLVGFVFLGPETPMAAVVMNLVGIGLGFGLFSSPNTNAIMGSVERTQYGLASAAVGTMRLVGQAASMSLVGFILALYLNGQPMSREVGPVLEKSLRLSFVLFAVLCVGGIFASLARGRVRAGATSGRGGPAASGANPGT